MRKIALAIPIGLLLILTACGQGGPPVAQLAPGATAAPSSVALSTPQPTEAPQPTAPQPTEAPPPTEAAPSAGPPATLVAAARQRLSRYLGTVPDDLALQSAESREWSDGSLGCPAPDQIYPQVITPGFLLTFSHPAQVERFAIHTGADEQQMVLCMNKQPIDLNGQGSSPQSPTAPPASASPDPASRPLVELARQNLAQELGIKPEDITLVGVEAVEWRDSSLGCPRPGMNYLQVITSGYRISLEAQGKGYEYHSDQSKRVVRCDLPGR